MNCDEIQFTNQAEQTSPNSAEWAWSTMLMSLLFFGEQCDTQLGQLEQKKEVQKKKLCLLTINLQQFSSGQSFSDELQLSIVIKYLKKIYLTVFFSTYDH